MSNSFLKTKSLTAWIHPYRGSLFPLHCTPENEHVMAADGRRCHEALITFLTCSYSGSSWPEHQAIGECKFPATYPLIHVWRHECLHPLSASCYYGRLQNRLSFASRSLLFRLVWSQLAGPVTRYDLERRMLWTALSRSHAVEAEHQHIISRSRGRRSFYL